MIERKILDAAHLLAPSMGAMSFGLMMNPMDFELRTYISLIPDTLTALGFAYEACSSYIHGEYDGRGMQLALYASLASGVTSSIELGMNNVSDNPSAPFMWGITKLLSSGSCLYVMNMFPRKKKPFPKPKQIYEKISSMFSSNQSKTEFAPFYEKI